MKIVMSLCMIAIVTLTGPLAVSAEADGAVRSPATHMNGLDMLMPTATRTVEKNEASTLFRERMSQSAMEEVYYF